MLEDETKFLSAWFAETAAMSCEEGIDFVRSPRRDSAADLTELICDWI